MVTNGNCYASITEDDANGDCYEAAGKLITESLLPTFAQTRKSRAISRLTKSTLVHAECIGRPIEGLKFGHAWVESGGMVIDQSNGGEIVMPKGVYYALGEVNKSKLYRYTPEEARRLMLKHETWGPWELKTDH